MTQAIGISLGDITGIGPEVTLKALAAELPRDDMRYVLFGEPAILQHWNERLQLALPLGKARLQLASESERDLTLNLHPGAAPAARAAVAWLRAGAKCCQQGELAALVTAPVNKAAIVRSGQPFVGQTELLSQLAQTERTAMMLLGTDEGGRWLRVALATVHISIKSVPEKLTTGRIKLAIELATQACRDLGLPRARVAVCGLNPHAGEGGEFGTEEITTIGPIMQVMQQNGFDVVGPLSGDTVFHYALKGDYDAVVAMYHDQGLAPLKAVAFESGINWTLGLPFIRTSPDHGTAYNIAGQGTANPSSMIAAIRLAKQLICARH